MADFDFDLSSLDDYDFDANLPDDIEGSEDMTSLEKLLYGTEPQRPTYVYFGPDANCTLELCEIEWSVYKYRPSLPANVMFLLLFLIAGGVHTWLGIRWKSWWFMGFMIAGCLSEVIGYGGRIMLWQNPWSFAGFMIQIVFVTGAPVYYTAAIYITLSKTIEHFSVEVSRVRPHLFYWFFIPADLVCLVLQATGGALSTVTAGASETGVHVAMVGLALQVAIIGIFLILYGDYLIRYFRSDKTRPLVVREKLFFGFLALAISLILGRSGYRCYELKQGYRDSDLITDEGLFIGLEGVLIYLACLALCIGHPGYIFSQAHAATDQSEDEPGKPREVVEVAQNAAEAPNKQVGETHQALP